ncbi:MAG TPA: single-stranded DNA-binding protein [Paenisporosarcina sp.]|nr:single-stranded DNA-binding protein [Paenisporosarcina sp.]
MNVATISGNLGKEIELRYTPSGKAVAKGSLAVKGSYKDSSGEYPTNWINFIAWGKVAEIISNFTKKGDKLVLSGEIITGSYEKSDGQKVYTTEINVNSFDLPPKSSGASNESSAYTPATEDEEDPDGLPF